jgi:hypothetical protein
LSRLSQNDFEILKNRIKEKDLRLVVADLPTTHMKLNEDQSHYSSILNLINNVD